jgi:hypothetical protein
MIIKLFNDFINEELTNILTYRSGSGKIKSFHKIYNDEDPDTKSLAYNVLL